MGARVTLQRIADELEVSKQTVSNAFNRPDQLSASLRDEILNTAARLGYSGPDPGARALSRGSTGVVGVILTERSADALNDPAATEFLAGVAEMLESEGKNLLLISGRPESSPGSSPVADAAVDGFVIYSLSPNDAHLTAARRRALPIVVVDQPEIDDATLVGVDQYGAARLAATHLHEFGHATVAVLALRFARDGRSGPVNSDRVDECEFPLTRQRLAGVNDTDLDIAVIWECPDQDVIDDAVDHIVDHTDATAIVAMSDVFAIRAIERLRHRGLVVPDDVSVTGFDDVPAAALVGLTTVAQDHRDKGRIAVRVLAGDASHSTVAATIIQRDTTGQVRNTDPTLSRGKEGRRAATR